MPPWMVYTIRIHTLTAEARRSRSDRRAMNEEQNAKRQALVEAGGGNAAPSVLPAGFSTEEIAAEARRPKHKVAVMIGYSGSGYKGMQMYVDDRWRSSFRLARTCSAPFCLGLALTGCMRNSHQQRYRAHH